MGVSFVDAGIQDFAGTRQGNSPVVATRRDAGFRAKLTLPCDPVLRGIGGAQLQLRLVCALCEHGRLAKVVGAEVAGVSFFVFQKALLNGASVLFSAGKVVECGGVVAKAAKSHCENLVPHFAFFAPFVVTLLVRDGNKASIQFDRRKKWLDKTAGVVRHPLMCTDSFPSHGCENNFHAVNLNLPKPMNSTVYLPAPEPSLWARLRNAAFRAARLLCIVLACSLATTAGAQSGGERRTNVAPPPAPPPDVLTLPQTLEWNEILKLIKAWDGSDDQARAILEAIRNHYNRWYALSITHKS